MPADLSGGSPPVPLSGLPKETRRAGLSLTTGWLIWLAMIAATQVVPRVTFRNAIQFLGLTLGSPVGLLLLCGWWIVRAPAGHFGRWSLPLACLLGLALCGLLFFPGPALVTLLVYGPPVATLGWLIGAQWGAALSSDAVTHRGHWGLLAGLVALSLVRFDGTDGAMNPRLAWRWSPSAENRLLASLPASRPAPAPAVQPPLELQPGDWPAFRGALRDSVNRTDRIATDWNTHPPRELWRIPVGPGWGSCCVVANRLFTQQQRGTAETLTAHDSRTGAELWAYSTDTRFEEAVSGAGPRATPTFAAGLLYACGANGHLVCCEAHTGRSRWSVELTQLGGSRPYWGYSSSPLIVGPLVIVYLGGGPQRGLAAFDRLSGQLVWTAGEAGHSYSSPHLATLHGRPQVLLISEVGLESFDPSSGQLLWIHEWRDPGINRDVQPLFAGDEVLLSTGIGGLQGWRRLQLTPRDPPWQVTVAWTQRSLRPYYNDSVTLGEHLFGFDQDIFTCVRLADGQRRWRAGRYGSGQVLLLAQQQLLLVQAEPGEVVLLAANPDRLTELGRFTPLADKTWNHPVVVQGRLYVRNDRELACFDLGPAPPAPQPSSPPAR